MKNKNMLFQPDSDSLIEDKTPSTVSRYRLADKNRFKSLGFSKSTKSSIKTNKLRKANKRKFKARTSGMGCSWKKQSELYYIELVFENEEQEQLEAHFHWIRVRKFAKEERGKYIDYFKKKGTPLSPGETVETRHLICYLDSYYEEHSGEIKFNKAFIYPAKKVGDADKINPPILCRHYNESFIPFATNQSLLGIYRNTIWHYKNIIESQK